MTSGNLKNIYDIHDEYPERTANSDSSKINLLDVLTNGSSELLVQCLNLVRTPFERGSAVFFGLPGLSTTSGTQHVCLLTPCVCPEVNRRRGGLYLSLLISVVGPHCRRLAFA